MKVLKRTLSLCVIFTMLMSMFVVSQAFAAVADYKIWMEASSTEVEVGQQVSVNVYITDRLDLAGAAMKIKWNPEYLYMSAESYEDDDTGDVINEGYENMPSVLMKYAFTPNLNDAEDKGIAIFMGARNNSGTAFPTSSANYLLGTLKFTVLNAAAGKNVDIGFVVSELEEVKGEMVDVPKTYCNDANGATIRFAEYNGVSLNVAGGEPEGPVVTVDGEAIEVAEDGSYTLPKTAQLYEINNVYYKPGYAGVATTDMAFTTVDVADEFGLYTDDQVARASDVLVTPVGDKPSYTVKTALGFVSSVKEAYAVAEKFGTEISLPGYEKVLDIPAVTFDKQTLTTFGAAVTSIYEKNLSTAFTARAYIYVTDVNGNAIKVYSDGFSAAYNG